MSLIGFCDDCGENAQLRYKPCVPLDEQSRPSVCSRCRLRREELAREYERGMAEPVPGAAYVEGGDGA